MSDSPQPDRPELDSSEAFWVGFKRLGTLTTAILGLYLLIWLMFLGCVLVVVWPPSPADAAAKPLVVLGYSIFYEGRLIVLVLVAGALGSAARAVMSFSQDTANEELRRGLGWTYTVRVPLGAVIALIFYVAIRGGLLNIAVTSSDPGITDAAQLNPFGISALAALVGMFAQRAMEKLTSIAENVFAVSK